MVYCFSVSNTVSTMKAQHTSWVKLRFALRIVCLLSLLGSFWIKSIMGQDYHDYDGGRRDPYGPPGGEDYDYNNPDGRMHDRPYGHHGEENGPRRKKFKLFEKRKYNFTAAKSFCKKRGGRLAQVMGWDEMERIHLLVAKGTKLKEAVWIGAGTREWKERSRGMGQRPNLRQRTGMLGGDEFAMCPSMKIKTKTVDGDSCFRRMAFICEFWMANSTTSEPTIGAPLNEKLEKDEMRRKREIFVSGDEVDEM